MQIYGLQKMTLLDYPGKVACTVFTGGCDYRCPFCHNFALAEGKAKPVMDHDGLLSFLAKRKGLLDGVVFSGGEPTLQKDLPELMRTVRTMGYSVKLDTNGGHPDILERILTEGLADYVAMDIKNAPEKYGETAGIEDASPLMERIKESIVLIQKKAPDYEFRTTVVHGFHTEEDMKKIGRMIAGARRYFIQPFVLREAVPRQDLKSPTDEELQTFLDAVREYVPAAELRGV